MRLTRPSALYKHSFIKAAKQILAEGNEGFLKTEFDENNFVAYCNKLLGFEKGIGQPDGYAHDTVFWLIDNDEFIGNLSLRHWLTEHLLNVGGHIGYIIAPQYRQQGYGTEILRLGLLEAKKLGINKVLVTCDNTNLASAKIIEKNGGVFENEYFFTMTGAYKRRYWIDNA